MDALQKDAEMARLWDGLTVEGALGPVSYAVTDRLVDVFCSATEETHPWFTKDSPFGGRIAPPVITGGDYSKLMASMGYNLGYHARHHAESLAPMRLGDQLTVTGRVMDKYKRRGLRYFVLDYQATNQRGEAVYRRTITATVGVLRDPAARGQYRGAALSAPPPRPGEQVLLQREMTQEAITRYSAQGMLLQGRQPEVQKGFHTDSESARRVGLRTNIGVALHYVAWLDDGMTERLGEGWIVGGSLDMAFVNTVEPGDVLTIRGLPSIGPGDARRRFEIVIQNHRDELVAIGETSGAPAHD